MEFCIVWLKLNFNGHVGVVVFCTLNEIVVELPKLSILRFVVSIYGSGERYGFSKRDLNIIIKYHETGIRILGAIFA